MVFKIESGIEMPKSKLGTYKREPRFPLDQMEVGQSFFVPKGDKDLKKIRSIVSATLSREHKKLGKKQKRFATRTMKKPDGVRVWRVEDAETKASAQPTRNTTNVVPIKRTTRPAVDAFGMPIDAAKSDPILPLEKPPVDTSPKVKEVTPKLDAFGVQWDGRYHSYSCKKNGDGSWRLKKGAKHDPVAKAYIADQRSLNSCTMADLEQEFGRARMEYGSQTLAEYLPLILDEAGTAKDLSELPGNLGHRTKVLSELRNMFPPKLNYATS